MSTDKPRICEVLGVGVGERFTIDGYPTDYGQVQVCEDGKLRRVLSRELSEVFGEVGHKIGTNALYYLLAHPEAIIRKPRFTTDEVATMRVLYAAGVRYVERKENNTLLWAMSEKDKGGNRTLYSGHVILCGDFPSALFSSILAGRSVTIADIIKNEKES